MGKSKSKSKSVAESLLFRALLRCALSKEGISLKGDDDHVFSPRPKSFYEKREDIPEYIKEEMKKEDDAFAAAYAVAAKKDKFYELCGVSKGKLKFDFVNELKKMEREMYGDLKDLELYGKKNEAIKKVEEIERERFFKIYGHPAAGPHEYTIPNIFCGKGNTINPRSRSSSGSIFLVGS